MTKMELVLNSKSIFMKYNSICLPASKFTEGPMFGSITKSVTDFQNGIKDGLFEIRIYLWNQNF